MDTVTVTLSLPSRYATAAEYQQLLSLAVGALSAQGNQLGATAVAGLLSALAGSSGGMVHGSRL